MTTNQSVGFLKLSDNAYVPLKGSVNAAGYDLRSPCDHVVPPCGKTLIQTDLTFQIPSHTYGRIAPRSGLAYNYFINVGGGVIDRDFTGNVSVLLFNHSNVAFNVKKGDRIAQIIFETILEPEMMELNRVDHTERGSKGFGSTGYN